MSLFEDFLRSQLPSQKPTQQAKPTQPPAPVPVPVPTPKPPKRENVALQKPSLGTKVINTVGKVLNYKAPKGSSVGAEFGKVMQKFPDTTIKTPKSAIDKYTDPTGYGRKVSEFITKLPGEMIRETGQAFELAGTEKGRKDIKTGIKKYPEQIKKVATPGKRLEGAGDLLNNPATITAFGLTNIPSPKNVIKEGVEQAVKQGSKEALEQGVKQVVKEGVEQTVKAGAKDTVREGIEQGTKRIVKNVDDAPLLLGPGDPEKRVAEAIKKNTGFRAKQEELYKANRAERFARAQKAGTEAGGGEQGLYSELGQLRGEMDKVKDVNTELSQQVSQSDVDFLVNKVNSNAVLTFPEKIATKKAVVSLFKEGRIPTEGELKFLREVYKPELVDAMLKTAPLSTKIKDVATNVLNVPRALMSSADFSAPFRQGAFVASSHPKDFSRSLKNMFGYAVSQKKFDNLYKEIQARPTYQAMREHGLALTDMKSAATREEAFMSNLAERIPVVGRLVRASDRAYTGFLNNLRADLFDTLYKNGEALGKGNDQRYLESLTSFINTSTGRGELKGEKLKGAAPLLNGLFFSPRLIMSRVNLLNPKYYAGLEPTVRKEALKTLVTFTATGMSILGAAKLAGADVETDPTSADFGKIKIGKTRYDIWGGFQSYAVFTARMITGKYTSTKTGKTYKYGEGFASKTRKDALYQFAEQKASPITSFGLEAMTGKDFEGNDFDLANTDPLANPITKRMLPMIAQDLKDTIGEYGEFGPIVSLPGLFGVGSQTYGPTIKKTKFKPRIGSTIR